jgi:hypothetical protein
MRKYPIYILGIGSGLMTSLILLSTIISLYKLDRQSLNSLELQAQRIELALKKITPITRSNSYARENPDVVKLIKTFDLLKPHKSWLIDFYYSHDYCIDGLYCNLLHCYMRQSYQNRDSLVMLFRNSDAFQQYLIKNAEAYNLTGNQSGDRLIFHINIENSKEGLFQWLLFSLINGSLGTYGYVENQLIYSSKQLSKVKNAHWGRYQFSKNDQKKIGKIDYHIHCIETADSITYRYFIFNGSELIQKIWSVKRSFPNQIHPLKDSTYFRMPVIRCYPA